MSFLLALEISLRIIPLIWAMANKIKGKGKSSHLLNCGCMGPTSGPHTPHVRLHQLAMTGARAAHFKQSGLVFFIPHLFQSGSTTDTAAVELACIARKGRCTSAVGGHLSCIAILMDPKTLDRRKWRSQRLRLKYHAHLLAPVK